MYIRKPTRSFKKSLRKILSSGNQKIIEEIEEVIEKLSNNKKLEERFKDHGLSGELRYFRECHIRPDLLLIYQISGNELILAGIGSHSELFG